MRNTNAIVQKQYFNTKSNGLTLQTTDSMPRKYSNQVMTSSSNMSTNNIVQKSRSILHKQTSGYTKYKQRQIQTDIDRIRQTKSQFLNQENLYKPPSLSLAQLLSQYLNNYAPTESRISIGKLNESTKNKGERHRLYTEMSGTNMTSLPSVKLLKKTGSVNKTQSSKRKKSRTRLQIYKSVQSPGRKNAHNQFQSSKQLAQLDLDPNTFMSLNSQSIQHLYMNGCKPPYKKLSVSPTEKMMNRSRQSPNFQSHQFY